MSTQKFDDSNMVAFLAKPTESDGYEQILDFLNGNPIKYALTVNPTIYTSCIEQFWATLRRDLQLEDAEGIECLPNADIFEQLALIGFVQVFLNKQVGDMSTHNEIFVTPSHTKKVFGNMKRIRKGFSKAVSPLFPTIMVQAQEEIGEGSAMPTHPHHTPIIQPSTSQPQKKQSRIKQRKDTKIPQSSGPTGPIAYEASNEENVPIQSNDPPLSRVNTLGSGEDRLTLKELMDLCTKLSDRVLDLETTKTTQAKEIASLKKRVKKLERKRKSKTPGMKRLFKIEVTLVDETQGRYDDAQMFDTIVFNGEEVFVAEQSEKVVEEVVSTAKVSAAATITSKEITLAQALAKLRSIKPKIVVQEPVQSATTTTPSIIPKAKSNTFRDPSESITRTTLTSIPSNIKDKGKAKMIEPEKPLKMKEQIRLDEELAFKLQAEEEEQTRLAREKAEKVEEANISKDNVLERAGEELEQEKEKKQKIHDDQEEVEMKKLIKIAKEGKIDQFQIIRANGSSKRYSSMIQMLRDFDREDLETLWKLMKAKHGSTSLEEGYERVLWGDLRRMFEHNVEDTLWINLLGKKVLIWKLFDSCGVHFVRFQDIHLFMLVEKRYPLTPATITEILNKKLQTDHLNEMCY
ncbi:hypothetical protein Tco_1547956 [Tanacetum coccineum]